MRSNCIAPCGGELAEEIDNGGRDWDRARAPVIGTDPRNERLEASTRVVAEPETRVYAGSGEILRTWPNVQKQPELARGPSPCSNATREPVPCISDHFASLRERLAETLIGRLLSRRERGPSASVPSTVT